MQKPKRKIGRYVSMGLVSSAALYAGLAGVFAAETPRLMVAAEPILPAPAPHFERTFDVAHFQKGNIHTHTTVSDGGSSPESTIIWYATHGYQFLALTDHNVLSHPERYATLQEPGFVLLPGEEVTMMGNGRQVHVNALCTKTRIGGGKFPSAAGALANAIGRIASQGGIAIVNHPNFDWGLSPDDVVDARDAALLEIASGHPYVRAAGDKSHPSHEQLWDRALTAGADFMGVAVDDVHRIDVSGTPNALPGKAWVQTFGEGGDQKAICNALSQGALYSSTGVELRHVAVTRGEYIVEPVRSDITVTFIGAGGEELSRDLPRIGRVAASYVIKGHEGYVRARADSPDGKHAWTPAVRVEI